MVAYASVWHFRRADKSLQAANSLKVGGNKPELKLRYRAWFNAQNGASNISATAPGSSTVAVPYATRSASSAADPSTAGDVASVAAAVEAPTITVLDPTANVSTVSMSDRLFVPSKEKVSAVTLRCIEDLRYTPGDNYQKKEATKDFSETLQPLIMFVSAFQSAMRQVQLTPEAGENETAVRTCLKETLPTIVAPQELSLFFAGWGVTVEREIVGTSQFDQTEEAELEAQLRMAMDNSIVTADAEPRLGQGRPSPHIDSPQAKKKQKKSSVAKPF